MTFAYGQGEFIEGEKRIAGEIILSEHKLYLRGPEGDLTQTYVPLEKIEGVRKVSGGLDVFVRLSIYERFTVTFRVQKKHLKELIKDMVARRQLKKKLLKSEWVDEAP